MPIAADKNSFPFSHVNMDFITDLPMSHGYDTLLLVIDHDCSKAIVLIPCEKTIDAIETAQLYFDNVYRRFGLPIRIISDRGPQFASKAFQELCKIVGIKSSMSTAYHPQTDGQAERTNQEIEVYLRIYCTGEPENWSQHIPNIEFAHNNRAHTVTKRTPFSLLMGYEPIALPLKYPKSNVPSVSQRLANLTVYRSEALAAHSVAAMVMKERTFRNFKPFSKGDKVWLDSKNLRIPGLSQKFKEKRDGPFRIKKVLSPLVYELDLSRTKWKIHPVFHAALLVRYTETEAYGPPHSNPPPDLIEGQEQYEVEAIRAHRGNGTRRRYLIKWKGYPTSGNSWEPESNLRNTQTILKAYKKLHQLA